MERENKSPRGNKIPASLRFGVICIAFMITGYQLALFLHRSAVLKIEANRDSPDTVFIYTVPSTGGQELTDNQRPTDGRKLTGKPGLEEKRAVPRAEPAKPRAVKKEAVHSPLVNEVRKATRKVRNFRFDPNEASIEELQELGFSPKQAAAIDNYRKKGGRFHSKEDFARSYVVSDSVYRRLKDYIDIPLLDLNLADSAAFDRLPGIGPYFASRMVRHRGELGGYSCPEQLLEIYNFGEDRLQRIRPLICCSPPEPFALWQLDENGLRRHPHIKNYRTAAAIVLFREHTPADCLSVPALQRAGILSQEQASALMRCKIAPPLTGNE
ncbi:MAG: helix-hairpin-helix domain-containing protein [Bacteroidales bacterium]|nr:helix-hairpin-helix domain-containing protein [Bacteroidales bacterium]